MRRRGGRTASLALGTQLKSLNYYWRLVATGYNFVSFGIGALIFSLTIMPVVRLWPGKREQRAARARQVIHQVFRLFAWQMRMTGVMSVSANDVHRLRREARGRVVIANHPSLIDVILLISLLPRSGCVVKQAMWRNPLTYGMVQGAGFISNASDSATLLARSKRVLDAGDPLVLFPEGTRTVRGKPVRFQRGAANIAVRNNAEILPVVIRNQPPTLSKQERWYQIPPSKTRYTITPQTPLRIEDVVDTSGGPALTTRRLNRYLENYYRSILSDE